MRNGSDQETEEKFGVGTSTMQPSVEVKVHIPATSAARISISRAHTLSIVAVQGLALVEVKEAKDRLKRVGLEPTHLSICEHDNNYLRQPSQSLSRTP